MVMGMNGNERRRVIGDKVRVEGVKSDSAANGRSMENEGDRSHRRRARAIHATIEINRCHVHVWVYSNVYRARQDASWHGDFHARCITVGTTSYVAMLGSDWK